MEAYPLSWPVDYQRTPDHKKQRSRFKSTLGQSRDFLQAEVRRLGGKNLIISSNVPIKQNGEMYADYQRYKLTDSGVAVYFTWKDKDLVMCCDQYEKVWENVEALGKSIEALRAMERYGCSDFIERAFTGFQALPAAGGTTDSNYAWDILGIPPTKDLLLISKAYKDKARKAHPDGGGSREDFNNLQEAVRLATIYAQGGAGQ